MLIFSWNQSFETIGKELHEEDKTELKTRILKRLNLVALEEKPEEKAVEPEVVAEKAAVVDRKPNQRSRFMWKPSPYIPLKKIKTWHV